MVQFFIISVGPGLYIERGSGMFSRTVTNNILDAKPYTDVDTAKAYAKKYKGELLLYEFRPAYVEDDEIRALRQALAEIMRIREEEKKREAEK